MRQIEKQTEHGLDKYVFMDAGEIPGLIEQHASRISQKTGGWAGGTMEQLRRCAKVGDESLVAKSEEFLAKIEDQIPLSQGWRNVDDVVGAVPNVPAYLAGHPQCMRRRQRAAKESAPLAIYMDLTSSAGIGAEDVQRRGIVLLALTRMLVEHRPVELWVGTSLGGYSSRRSAFTTAWRIDTTPLDLARAAYHIGSTPMSRAFGYGVCQGLLGSSGNWPFDDYDRHCRTAEARLRAAMDWGQVMYIPPIMLGDDMTQDPVGWLRRVMKQYVPSNNGDE